MVNQERLHHILMHPDQVHSDDLQDLEQLLKEYPYFQAARSVYLKALHNSSISTYNKELQVTAAHTADRGVLFDFITSEVFLQNRVSEQIKVQNEWLENIEVDAQEVVIKTHDLNEASDFNQVTDADLFEKKTSLDNELLEFKEGETYSFNEWLKITQLKPIKRPTNKNADKDKAPKTISDKRKLDKMRRIDEFLRSKPKITPRKNSTVETPDLTGVNHDKQLMTETLARVYLAQKNYDKAIKSYEILILQHPEKSGFFADRIREIKNLQSNT